MALAGAATTARAIARQRSQHCSFLSIPHRLRLKSHHSPSIFPLQRFSSYPSTTQTGFNQPIRAVQGTTPESVTRKKEDEEKSSQNWKIKMLYDGDCPLCMREVNMLRERDKSYGAIKFVDIGSEEYSPEENQGLDYKTVMGRIHAILSDGTVVTDVEAFRRLYEQVDLGWVYAITKYEPGSPIHDAQEFCWYFFSFWNSIVGVVFKFDQEGKLSLQVGKIVDAVYSVWAKTRLQITGRPSLEEILESRVKNKPNKGEVCNDSKACKM